MVCGSLTARDHDASIQMGEEPDRVLNVVLSASTTTSGKAVVDGNFNQAEKLGISARGFTRRSILDGCRKGPLPTPPRTFARHSR